MKQATKIIIGVFVVVIVLALLDVMGLGIISVYQEIYGDWKLPSCDQLPTIEQVDQVVAGHQQDKERIEATCKYGGIYTSETTSVGREQCPGKAYVVVQYATVRERDCFKKLMGKTFYGIPYVMANM